MTRMLRVGVLLFGPWQSEVCHAWPDYPPHRYLYTAPVLVQTLLYVPLY